MRQKVSHRSFLRWSSHEILGWHLKRPSLMRAFPPEDRIIVTQRTEYERNRLRYTFYRRIFGIWQKWVFTLFPQVEIGTLTLKMEKGGVRWMEHVIRIPSCSNEGCELIDLQEFEVKKGPFAPLMRKYHEKRFARLLKYKHEIIDHDLELHNQFAQEGKKRILIAGSGGMIGKALRLFLLAAGHEVKRLVRSSKDDADDVIHWNPDTGEVERSAMEGFDAVINLAGRSISGARWSEKEKRLLRQSRVEATEKLTRILGGLESPPKVFLCASALGLYGDHGSNVITEDSLSKGESFLSGLAGDWERASQWVQGRGVRLANLRFGVVLSPAGGALHKMLPAFRIGLGTVMGNGNQYTSWIAIDDVVGAIYHTLLTPQLSGGINFCTPNPVTWNEFGNTLAQQFNKGIGPALTPAFIQLLFGQRGHELFLTSQRVMPEKLEASGYRFRYPLLSGALDHLVG